MLIIEFKTKRLRKEARETIKSAGDSSEVDSVRDIPAEISPTSHPKSSTMKRQASFRKKTFMRQETLEGRTKLTRLGHKGSFEDTPKLNLFKNSWQIKAPPQKSARVPASKDHSTRVQKLDEYLEKARYEAQKISLVNAPFAKGVHAENALVICSFKDEKALITVLRKLILFNRVNKNKLIVLYEPWLIRYRATMIIQRWIRGYQFRNKQLKLFYDGTLRMLPGVSPGN